MINLKQSTPMFTFVKKKELEDEAQVYTFVGANTLPDRVPNQSKTGEPVEGEILAKNVLSKIAGCINDNTKLGGEFGSYRTISLFHDRVMTGDYELEEAGFVVPGSAVVKEMDKSQGNFELLVDVEVNKHYVPKQHLDYTPEKIDYKIRKGALGISIEYNNKPEQERIVEVDGKKYNYVFDTDDFRGFGFARPNLIGNPGAVRVKEIELSSKNIKGDKTMDEAKLKEVETQLAEATAKIKELEEGKAKAEEEKKSAEEAQDKAKAEGEGKKIEETEKKVDELQEKVKELKLQKDETAVKMKESLELAFSALKFEKPAKIKENVNAAKIKEVYESVIGKEQNFVKFKEATEQYLLSNEGKIKEMMSLSGAGFPFEEHQTLKVKCVGNGSGQMIVMPSVKTKDVLDSDSMNEATYYQTNAMFADRYVGEITETFLKEDTFLTAIPKQQHIGGNDKYQWKLWLDYGTVTGSSTFAVDPTVTSVSRTVRKFVKMETPIREYRDGVEVTDFTQHHSMAAVGDLLGMELQRAAEVVTESMNADLFKPKSDMTTGWVGFLGLLGVADSATYTTMYGRTRTAALRLLDGTTANTYLSTSEAISVSVVRAGYEKVLAHGSGLGNLVIVMHPTQMRRLWDTEDAAIRNNIMTMAGAPPAFGFNRAIVPHIDGIPVIRDYRCESSAAAADCFGVVDFSSDKGFNLVVSKPLGARGLAKVGTSESAYVSFWGCSVYKSPRNVFMHDSLTTS